MGKPLRLKTINIFLKAVPLTFLAFLAAQTETFDPLKTWLYTLLPYISQLFVLLAIVLFLYVVFTEPFKVIKAAKLYSIALLIPLVASTVEDYASAFWTIFANFFTLILPLFLFLLLFKSVFVLVRA
jgi:hypothetical protein